MATPTYTPIASITLGSSASSVTFSSIPQDYRDLVLVETVLGAGGEVITFHQFNSDSGTNYSYVLMSGNGSSASSSSATDQYFFGANANTTDPAVGVHHIMDYSATDKHTTILTRRNNTRSASDTMALAQRWANTSAVTSIFIDSGLDNFGSGSTFALYGIEA